MKRLINIVIAVFSLFTRYLSDIVNVIFVKLHLGSDDARRHKELPSPKGLPVVGTLFSLIAAGGGEYLHLYVDDRHKKFGTIYREAIGPLDAVFVSDPKYMRKIYALEGKYPNHILPEPWILYNEKYNSKRGLYFMDGEEWHFHRRLLNNILLKADPNLGSADVQNDIIMEFIDDWKKSVGKDMNVREEQFYELSLSFIVGSLMGSSYLTNKHLFKKEIDILASFVYRIFEESCRLSLLPAKLAVFLNLPAWKRFVEYVSTALDLGRVMAEKMMDLCSEDSLLKQMLQEDLTKDMVTRIVVDLILAASDTTSYTTQWAVYLLSRNPDVQDQLVSDCGSLSQVRGVIRETLRLYPAAPFITRSLPEDVTIGGYHIPAKKWCILSLYSSGRDERNFVRPEEFWPGRWSKDEDSKSGLKGVLDANASQPYAMGSRNCIGRKLAEAQMMLTISKLASTFHMDSLGETDIILRLVPVPKTPVRLHLRARE